MSFTERPTTLEEALDNLTEENWHAERALIEAALGRGGGAPPLEAAHAAENRLRAYCRANNWEKLREDEMAGIAVAAAYPEIIREITEWLRTVHVGWLSHNHPADLITEEFGSSSSNPAVDLGGSPG